MTTRQKIEELVAKGLTVRQIADLLRVSTQNVYKHLKALELEAEETADIAS